MLRRRIGARTVEIANMRDIAPHRLTAHRCGDQARIRFKNDFSPIAWIQLLCEPGLPGKTFVAKIMIKNAIHHELGNRPIRTIVDHGMKSRAVCCRGSRALGYGDGKALRICRARDQKR